ncbi:MAG TPA: 16S rRNA (cytosine(1402)-N(4))-methyltransferase RsmH [Candidatus Microsaccharimonas sp.]|nr:16S rRNA (cytosine(1402)-N(4))-methyltransferase RsmH [Candidatus Microsaccharimonas sp.]
MHQDKNQNSQSNDLHEPVLLDSVLDYLAPQAGESYLDLTAGYGGHAAAILDVTGAPSEMTLVDRDDNAIRELTKRFKGKGVDVRHQDFLSASRELVDEQATFDMILADLGVSSPHLNEAGRGFSLQHEGPLDMRMDQQQELSAEIIANTYSESELADILWKYGEEPKSRQIARLIVHNRPVRTTTELAAIVSKAWPGRSRVHPATRTFQALRIAVNDELKLLEHSLPLWTRLLAPGGRLAVISFHSLEDGLVKRFLSESSGDRYDTDIRLLTKSPVIASASELAINPRARSAKLRAAVKIKI